MTHPHDVRSLSMKVYTHCSFLSLPTPPFRYIICVPTAETQHYTFNYLSGLHNIERLTNFRSYHPVGRACDITANVLPVVGLFKTVKRVTGVVVRTILGCAGLFVE